MLDQVSNSFAHRQVMRCGFVVLNGRHVLPAFDEYKTLGIGAIYMQVIEKTTGFSP